jgi:potassium-dependent mechanosensitive channel
MLTAMKVSSRSIPGLLISLLLTASALFGQDSLTANADNKNSQKINPSNWVQQSENAILLFESRLITGLDSSFMEGEYARLKKDFEITLNDLEAHGSVMRIRTLDDVNAKLQQQKSQLDKWRAIIRKQNDVLAGNYLEIEKMLADSIGQSFKSDSVLGSIYSTELSNVETNLRRTESMYQDLLKKNVSIENKLNVTNFRISRAIMDVAKELRQRNAAIFNRTHPAFWQLSRNTYTVGIYEVLVETVKQNLDSLKFYAKNAYIRVILFRLLLLLITLLPIWYFKKHRKGLDGKDVNQPYRFVHKYTGASTSSFVLVMAPFIFVNSPHIFLEFILITLAITTSMIFVKEQPNINKKYLFIILGAYVILKLLNLLVSVTFFGRIAWTLSIFVLFPLIGLYRSIKDTSLSKKWLFQTLTALATLMFLGGWILNFTGHYPLGRILLLAGLDQFFLAIILYVAIFSFIDFIAIIANIYNASKNTTLIKVNLIYNKLLYLVRFIAVAFWFSSFIAALNAKAFLKQHAWGFFTQQLTIGSVSVSPGGLLIFFIVLYLAFYLSSLLDGLFYDEKRTEESSGKTSLGSIVLILRLFILSSGFIMGLILAGIPLNNLNLFVSALGVGIGFGLQSMILNLISGIIIAFEKPIYVGDIIEIEGTRGRVTDIGLRATKVDTADGAVFVVPNGELTSKVLKNWTLTSRTYKIETTISVDHNNNPNMVAELVEEVLKETPFILPFPKPKIQLEEIAPQAIRFSVSCWIGNISESGRLQSELLKKIHTRLGEANVVYPKNVKD